MNQDQEMPGIIADSYAVTLANRDASMRRMQAQKTLSFVKKNAVNYIASNPLSTGISTILH